MQRPSILEISISSIGVLALLATISAPFLDFGKMFNRSLPEPIYEALRPYAESQAVWDTMLAVLVFSVIGFVCVYVLRRFLIAKQGPTPLTDRKAYNAFKAGRP